MSQPSPSGTAAAIISLPWPWPVLADTILLRKEFDSGHILVLKCLPSGTLRAELFSGDDTLTLSTDSCAINAVEQPLIFLAATWELPNHLRLRINKTNVASSDASESIPASYDIPVRASEATRKIDDLSSDNEAARISRRGMVKGHRPNPNSIPGSYAYIRDQLGGEVSQLRDLIGLIDQGAVHHVTGLAACLRRLIAEDSRPPLLQLVAAHLDAPLIVYTSLTPRERIFESPLPIPDFALLSEIAATPNIVVKNPVDLDVWLQFDGALCHGRYYSNRQTIKAIGNTVGAHIDRDIHPLVAMLRTFQSDYGVGRVSSQLLIYVRELAIVSFVLGEQLLAQK